MLPEACPARTVMPMTATSKERVMASSRPLAKIDKGVGATSAIGSPGLGRLTW